MNASMEAYWLPFTPNRYFKAHPKVVTSAKGAYYKTVDGRSLFDSLSGLWCSPIGHGHPKIVEAFRHQAEVMDFAPPFQVCNPVTFALAEKLVALAPDNLSQVFFVNSGSEAVDTALKIALAYHRVRGQGTRTRMIGRERGYHGVGFGGISVGGMVANRKAYSALMLPGVDHLRHPWDPKEMAFSRGQPAWGLHFAEDLERLVALHDASNIAAVIVEPVQGSTGVLVPPLDYLQRLREICTRHGILLIFDEVITGFGRTGANFGAQRFGVRPDMITFAKAVTNGTIPLGGVLVSHDIYSTTTSIDAPAHMPELLHGYTYSGHPMAAAVGLAALEVMAEEGLIARAAELAPILEQTVHALRGEPGVTDIRNIGLTAAVDLEAVPGKPGLRAFRVFEHGFNHSHLFRATGDTISLAPPFISTPQEIADTIDALRTALRAVRAMPEGH
jgi:beta-alanine--pyruvate transaminase